MRARLLSFVALSAAVLLTITACGSPTAVPPGPTASAPVCAEVLQALPDELSGAASRTTNSQATAAWGDPAITLRCGVQPTGPTTDRCISVEGSGGDGVDWVVAPTGTTDENTWQFTTYGRFPAVEVTVPVAYAGTDATTTLVDLGPAVSLIPQQNECIGAESA